MTSAQSQITKRAGRRYSHATLYVAYGHVDLAMRLTIKVTVTMVDAEPPFKLFNHTLGSHGSRTGETHIRRAERDTDQLRSHLAGSSILDYSFSLL
jgi:hypothetical protein